MRIGVDLGGSHIAIGLISNEGIIIDKIEYDWTKEDKKDIKSSIKSSIITLSREILKKYNYNLGNIEILGIGSPGTIMSGKILNATNLGIDEFDIKKELEEEIPVKVAIRNDAKCAAICEKKYGSIKDYSDAVFLTLGTGIGGAVFLGEKLLEPKRFSGFEIGHMTIQKNGEKCSCGKIGCFEKCASMKTLKKMFADEFYPNSDKVLHSADILKIVQDEKDNPAVKKIVNKYIDNLSIGLVNLIDIFEPEVICLGGGFIYYKDLLFPMISKSINEGNKNFNKGSVPHLTIAKMGNDAGIIGAAMQE